ncbi:MAG: GIY-YIG nuclease family protein [Gammaproteobacteria bacterium]
MSVAATWWLYLIACGDESVYTGIAMDVGRRLAEHRAGAPRGARYLRGRGPLRLLVAVPVGNRSEASSAEYWVKRCSAAEKRAFAQAPARLSEYIAALKTSS